jgi:hypothetical protein
MSPSHAFLVETSNSPPHLKATLPGWFYLEGTMNREASEYHEFWDQVDLSTPVELENVTPAVGNRSLI